MYLTPQGKGKKRKRRAVAPSNTGIAGDSANPFDHITIEGFSDDRTQQIKTELGKMFRQPCADAFHAAGLISPEEMVLRDGLQIRHANYLWQSTAKDLGLKEGDFQSYRDEFSHGAQGGTFAAVDTLNGKAQIYLGDKAFTGEQFPSWLGFYEVIRHEVIHAVGAPNQYPSLSQTLHNREWRDFHNDLACHPYYRTIMAVCH